MRMYRPLVFFASPPSDTCFACLQNIKSEYKPGLDLATEQVKAQWKKEQNRLRSQLVERDDFRWPLPEPQYIAGLDISFVKVGVTRRSHRLSVRFCLLTAVYRRATLPLAPRLLFLTIGPCRCSGKHRRWCT
jgi:hypothetical protein